MNTCAFETDAPSALAQLWRVLKEFHTGDFLRELFDKHHLNLASVGRSMGTTGQNSSGMFNRAQIHDETLARLSKATGLDILGMVQRKKAQLYGLDVPTMAMEPAPPYGRGSANDLVVHLDDFDEVTQLKILRFLQQLPKRHR
jgi:hypothetical protein